MSGAMGEAISAAVDQAVSGAPGGTSGDKPSGPEGAQKPEGASDANAAAKPAAAPAAGSGSEPAVDSSSKPEGSTRQTDDGSQTEVETEAGEPPKEKWPTILSNARETGRQDAIKEYGLEGFDPAQVNEHLQTLFANPVGYFYMLGNALASRGLIRRRGSGGAPTGNGAPAGNSGPVERPKPSLRSEDGKPAYTADEMDRTLEWQRQQILEELGVRLQPLEQQSQQAQFDAISAKAWGIAQEKLTDAETWEGFAELKPQIIALMERDKRVTLDSAYNRLYQPWAKTQKAALSAKVRQQTLDELNHAPDPNTIKPGQAAAGSSGAEPRRRRQSLDKDFDAAVQHGLSQNAG